MSLILLILTIASFIFAFFFFYININLLYGSIALLLTVLSGVSYAVITTAGKSSDNTQLDE